MRWTWQHAARTNNAGHREHREQGKHGRRRGRPARFVSGTVGLALLAASVIAGALWDATGPQGTFLAGAFFTVLTILGLLAIRVRLRRLRHV